MVKNMLPSRRRRLFAALLLSVAGAVTWGNAPGRAQEAAGAETDASAVVVDWRTGVALYGIDPVAYFSDAQAIPGRADNELRFSGVVWRFRNPGNRDAFAADSATYLPRFAGYDPIAAGRGVATPGNPLVWLIHDQRLYLFHAPETRAAFLANPREAITAGLDRWPALRARLDATGSIAEVPR